MAGYRRPMACEVCGGETRFVEQYNQHWCDACQAYRGAAGGKRKGPNLWLVVGLPIAAVGIILGILIFTSVSAFKSYVDKSRSSEARENLHALFRGAEMYRLENAQLPAISAGPTPPLGACCDQGGPCAPDPSRWDDPVWSSLDFSVVTPSYYSYEYQLGGDDQSFSIYAYGDLDCDGVYSTYAMHAFGEGDRPLLEITNDAE